MRARRLFVLVALAIAPAIAACGTLPTAGDEPSTTPPADTTSRKDNHPWG